MKWLWSLNLTQSGINIGVMIIASRKSVCYVPPGLCEQQPCVRLRNSKVGHRDTI